MQSLDRMNGQLETLEVAYDMITERPLITDQDGMRFTFDDGSEARSLPSAITNGTALLRFAVNQLKQRD